MVGTDGDAEHTPGDGYWLVCVSRKTGHASAQHFDVRDEAWQRSLDIESNDPAIYTTVVPQRIPTRRRHGTPGE